VQIPNIQIQKILDLKLNRAQASQKAGSVSSTGADKLTLSGKAADVQSVKSKLSGLPEIRVGIVKGFKSKVQSGDYQAGGTDIAGSMFESALINRTKV
jgi:anti-sigma28 factor (negative regulator of flagellin synthesis)